MGLWEANIVSGDFGYNIEVGENFYANHGCVILDGAKVILGIMYLWLQTVVSILPAILWIENDANNI